MKIFLSIIVILILLILWWWVYFGFFEKVNFETKQIGWYDIVYKNNAWDYTKVSDVFTNISVLLKKNWIQYNEWIGVYFSDPNTTPKENLLSSLGYVVSGMTEDQFNILKLQDESLKRAKLWSSQAIVTSFPYKNSLSLMVWPIFMYPKIEKYMSENNIKPVPMMEIYDMTNDKEIKFIIVQDEDYYNLLTR